MARSHLLGAIVVLVITCVGQAAYGQCTRDTDCKGDRVCIEGRCTQPKACQENAECCGGLTCQNGLCLPPVVAPTTPPPEAPSPPPTPESTPAPEAPPAPSEAPPPAPEAPPPPQAPSAPPAPPPVVQPPPVSATPTIAASAEFRRKRNFTVTMDFVGGFFARSQGGMDATRVIGGDASVGFTLTQQKRLALQMALEIGGMADPSSANGTYAAVPMGLDLGFRYDPRDDVALDLRVGGGGVVSIYETVVGGEMKAKMHGVGLVAVNFFFLNLLHAGLDTWFGRHNALILIKVGVGF